MIVSLDTSVVLHWVVAITVTIGISCVSPLSCTFVVLLSQSIASGSSRLLSLMTVPVRVVILTRTFCGQYLTMVAILPLCLPDRTIRVVPIGGLSTGVLAVAIVVSGWFGVGVFRVCRCGLCFVVGFHFWR